MFPSRFIVFVGLAVLFSVAVLAFHLIGGAALAAVWVAIFAALLGFLLLKDRHPHLRSTGAALMGLALLGILVAVFAVPVHAAEAIGIVAPPGDTGFWGTINGWINTGLAGIVATAVTFVCAAVRARTKINIRTDQEQRLIELMKTGAYQGMHELEIAIDDHWTTAQRQKLVERMVGWAESRGAAELKKLGLPSFVVTGMARKALGQLQATGLVGADFDPTEQGFDRVVFTGNPGETPALDHAAGGKGGN